jgi:hypothetical protein
MSELSSSFGSLEPQFPESTINFHGLPEFDEIKALFKEDFSVCPPNQDSKNSTWVNDLNGGSENIDVIPRELLLSSLPIFPPRDTFIALRKWRGQVIGMKSNTFKAKLDSLLEAEPQKVADVFLEEVSPEERELIKEGAIFYWSIGYLNRPSGRIRASVIRFQRQPLWSERNISEAQSRAEKLMQHLQKSVAILQHQSLLAESVIMDEESRPKMLKPF